MHIKNKERKTISVAMIGVRSHYAVPRILNDLKVLDKFIIDYGPSDNPLLARLMSQKYRKKIINRNLPELLEGNSIKLNWIGFSYAVLNNIFRKYDAVTDLFHWLYSYIFKLAAYPYLRKASYVYAYEGGAVRGKEGKLILEQTIVPYKTQLRVLIGEEKKWPNLFKISLLKRVAFYFHIKREAKDWQASDKIICPSEYVKNELIHCGVPAEKISIVEYGVDLNMFDECQVREKKNNESLKIVFVGDLSIRKGAIYLLQSAKELSERDIEFNICGNVDLPGVIIKEYEKYVKFHGRLAWGDLIQCLKNCHLFVFPSLSEGSAMSIIEATASGLPVICTNASGSRVREAIDGFIINEVSTNELIEKIMMYYDNPEMISIHSKNALMGRGDLSLDEYKEKLKSIIINYLD